MNNTTYDLSYFNLPCPTPDEKAHSQSLMAYIVQEIRQQGAIPFRRFMELALYSPLGYYRVGYPLIKKDSEQAVLGRDFVTAPELSPLWGRCVARCCLPILRQTGGALLEFGAGSGRLAVTMLRELEAHGLPDAYFILEVSGALRAHQLQLLQAEVPHLVSRVHWLERLPTAFRGVMIANEVLDAMPVECFRMTPDGPKVRAVTIHEAIYEEALCHEATVIPDDTWVWTEIAPDSTLLNAISAIERDIGTPLPEGYCSEINPALNAWIASSAQALEVGALLVMDYGYTRRDYYRPERSGGTLLCHYRHRVHDNPLILVGLQDITASVDFTAVARAAQAMQLQVAGFTTQGYFLLGCGILELLAAIPMDTLDYLQASQQIKVLTLPGQMGERCQVMALTRGIDEAGLVGFRGWDRRDRLFIQEDTVAPVQI